MEKTKLQNLQQHLEDLTDEELDKISGGYIPVDILIVSSYFYPPVKVGESWSGFRSTGLF
jgi:hypothetical protein